MKTYAWLCILGTLVAASCLEKFELPDTAANGGTDGSNGVVAPPPCGGSGEACCAEPLAACDARLRCDETSSTCVVEEARLCTSVAQCHPGQTCCPSGLLGNCVTLAAGGACPAPDLAIVSTPETLSFFREERRFDPAVPADACAVEKGCVGGFGLRQLLGFSIEIENQGDADFILGDPSRTPGFLTAACDGQSYFPNFLSYQLVDLGGVPVPGAAGQLSARCQNPPEGFSSRFSCQFFGVWRGFRETYRDEDCQWVDITGVPAGDYLLQVTLNADALRLTRTERSTRRFGISLPSFDEPLQACPADDFSDPTLSTSTTFLLGFGPLRECGWSTAPAQTGLACSPHERVSLGCPDCASNANDPILRVCEGTSVCSAGAALGGGDDTYATADCNQTLNAGNLSEDACYALSEADPLCLFCTVVNACPIVDFECPESGTYSYFVGSSDAALAPACNVIPLTTNPGVDADP